MAFRVLRSVVTGALGVLLLAGPLVAEVRLVMVEQAGCAWCAAWHREIGPEYPLTPEGAAAPLWPVDKHAALPDGLTLGNPVVFTPTFVLVRDGVEVARLEGYGGEEFFWVLLDRMLTDAGVEFTPPAGGDG